MSIFLIERSMILKAVGCDWWADNWLGQMGCYFCLCIIWWTFLPYRKKAGYIGQQNWRKPEVTGLIQGDRWLFLLQGNYLARQERDRCECFRGQSWWQRVERLLLLVGGEANKLLNASEFLSFVWTSVIMVLDRSNQEPDTVCFWFH